MAKTGPGLIAPALVRHALPLVRPILRLAHRPTLEGFEHLPNNGPFLLVSNHSAGIGQAELISFAVLYMDAVLARNESLEERRLAGFAHPLGFRVPLFGSLLRAIGAIPSTYEAARSALADGVPLLVFPGGDHETLRPIWQANRVDFGGRKGFLRIARETRVPIVPMGISGSHYTAPVLFRARWLSTVLILPRLAGLKRWGITLLGLAGAALLSQMPWWLPLRVVAIWLWLTSPVVFTPFVPWTIRIRIGEPLPAESLFDGANDELESAYRRVEDEVQALVTPGASP